MEGFDLLGGRDRERLVSGGHRGFWVAAGLIEGIVPQPVYDDDGWHVPLQWEALDGETLREDDPNEIVPTQVGAIDAMLEAFDRGILPCPGSLLDQPVKAMSGIKLWRQMLERARRVRAIRERGG